MLSFGEGGFVFLTGNLEDVFELFDGAAACIGFG
jgi:hypothetical protein